MGTQAVIRSKMHLILPTLRTQLQTVLSWGPERVLILARDEPPFDAQAEQYCWMRVLEGAHESQYDLGAGRVDSRARERISVTLRTRVILDESTSDVIFLTDSSLGHLTARHSIVDALHDFQPQDSSGNWLVACPVKFAGFGRPNKDRQRPIWGESVMNFDIYYALDLDQARQ